MAKSKTSTKMRSGAAIIAAAAVTIAAAGCSSSGSDNSSSGAQSGGAASGSNKTITVGLLTDMTGPAASGNKTSVDGVKAGTFYAARNGYTVKYVVADTQTNPAAVGPAAKKLVTQDKVDAVLSVSSLTLLAAPYLTAQGIPVIGAGEDGPEWTKAKNMFSVFGALNTTKVATTFGDYLKSQGVTNFGGLGYGVSPVSAEAVKGDAASAEAAGIKVGYLNANFPFGSTNVAPEAIKMKDAGVDGFAAATDPNTAFALITALKNQGVVLKASMLATGYGSDLTQAGPGALAAAQNVNFVMTTEPFSMNTDATKQMGADMKSAGTPVDQPTYAQYAGYLSVGLLVQALQGSNGSTSHSELISSLTNIHDWNGVGLFGSQKVDINNRTDFVAGPNNCMWVAKLENKTFVAVSGAVPICGELIPGKTVSSSS